VADVEVTDRGQVRYLTLNRPEVRNAFTVPMIGDLLAALRDYADREDLGVAVLTGAGDAFCAGGDVRGMGATRPTPAQRKALLWDGVHRLARFAHEELDKPLVAMVNGAAIGAGLDLALMCDVRFTAEDATLAASYLDLGLPPGNGAAWYLTRLAGRPAALDLLWTGRRFSGSEGRGLGVVEHTYPGDELADAVHVYCELLASRPRAALRVVKRLVRQSAEVSLSTSLDLVSSHFAWLQETADHREGVAAFAEKRPPVFNRPAEEPT
jgi:2-(1,2-epoxy-1,2-dihydrophenyl)acetyl-CoA isomerase